ncbi:MAG: rhodanese-like domain-containing protein [Candidatus Abyssobacteria bacterium SURF_17]|jgi:rhodanese-related sulfurtransferase|uniref:Rhodanese-like domain-containing protein n=1 Tax=Candidatus Abyssobacteria bacterium SURF_17 TaxID=2093361 RepID=A0A419EYZ3_9BACT|nr:MAG: rhodanese-like domain-containing protein [Candidatus Abyssubacteria bacterium SURF_17]
MEMTITETLKRISPRSAFAYFDQKLKYEIGPMELKEKIEHNHRDFQLVDVRSPEAYREGHIPGGISIPFEEFLMRSPEFSEDRDNIVYCYSLTCQLADRAAHWLAEKGYPVKMLIGGFEEWRKAELSVEK